MTPKKRESPLDDITHGIAQTMVGAVFLIVGLTVNAVALGPAVYSWLTKGPHTDVSLILLLVGMSVSVFGAACIPSLLPVVSAALRATIGALLSAIPLLSRGQMTAPLQEPPKKPEQGNGEA